MANVIFKNANVISIDCENIKTKSGEWRRKDTIVIGEPTDRGVIMQGVEIWDDNIGRLLLKKGETLAELKCRAVGRTWGGRWSYTLIAYAVTRYEEEKPLTPEQEFAEQEQLHQDDIVAGTDDALRGLF